jgi:His Kinase A (phospho-acceptor) domain/HAMP domain
MAGRSSPALHGIRPVEEIATTARHISSTNLRERIHPEGYPFELASLASTFNQMLDRLEESFECISKFSTDIAHDLRTPVNNIRGEAEVALARPRSADEYRDVIESCLEEAVRLSDLIGDLLFLARAEPLGPFAPRAGGRGRTCCLQVTTKPLSRSTPGRVGKPEAIQPFNTLLSTNGVRGCFAERPILADKKEFSSTATKKIHRFGVTPKSR